MSDRETLRKVKFAQIKHRPNQATLDRKESVIDMQAAEEEEQKSVGDEAEFKNPLSPTAEEWGSPTPVRTARDRAQ